MKIQKLGFDTDCSRHQDFKHTNLHLGVPKFNLQYAKLNVKAF